MTESETTAEARTAEAQQFVNQVEALVKEKSLTIQKACRELGKSSAAYYNFLDRLGLKPKRRPEASGGSVLDRYSVAVEQVGGRFTCHCPFCEWGSSKLSKRDLSNDLARHFRYKHQDIYKPSPQNVSAVKLASIRRRQPEPVPEPELGPTLPMKPTQPMASFFCPRCGLDQSPISKAYQAVGIAQQFGYELHGQNGSGKLSLRFCSRCGLDLLPAAKAMQP